MRLAPVFVALMASTVAQAATPIDGWYAGVFGGYAYVPNNVNNTSYGLTRSNASYKPGFDAGGSFGYKSHPMRYEGELTYLKANLKDFTINGVQQTNVGGYSDAIFAMANVYYDFPNLLNALQPFLGVGIGYGWIQGKFDSHDPLLGSTQFKGQDSAFSYQGTAGLTYNFSEEYALNIGYRYIATNQVNALGKIFQAQLANLGMVYRFDGKKYK